MGTRYRIDTDVDKAIFDYFNKHEIFKGYNGRIKDIAIHSIDVPIERVVDKILYLVEQKIDYDETYSIIDSCMDKYKDYIGAFKEHFGDNKTCEECANKYSLSLRTFFRKLKSFRQEVEIKLKTSGVEYEK